MYLINYFVKKIYLQLKLTYNYCYTIEIIYKKIAETTLVSKRLKTSIFFFTEKIGDKNTQFFKSGLLSV